MPPEPADTHSSKAPALGEPGAEPTRSAAERRRVVEAALAERWPRIRGSALQRAETIADFVRDPDGARSGETRTDARRAAHQLAGSTGAFGLRDVSATALRIEAVLGGDGALDRVLLRTLTEQLVATLNASPTAQ